MDRKNVLYIAVSLDGMIAREDGSIDWLDEFEGEGITDTAIFIRRLIPSS